MLRLPRFVSTPLALILAGCIVVGIAFFIVERPTVLNALLPLIVYTIFGQPMAIATPWMNLQFAALIVACMMAFALPAYSIVWMVRRVVPNHVLLILITAWLLCFLYLFMVGPEGGVP